MSQLIISTNRLLYPLTGSKSISLPSIDIQRMVANVAHDTGTFFKGSLVADFWALFSKGTE